ncbi:MAG: hypothetical protein JW940_37475 [Polyangiaceae bacterium]|nr:hypothetical protein [Polyangiaceae bacterium]
MQPNRALATRRLCHGVRRARPALVLVFWTCSVVVVGACLDRPVAPEEPHTSNVFVDQMVRSGIDRIDLLFMIDNSRSMQDKQRLLSRAVPTLLQRLLNPPCIDVTTGLANEVDGPDSACPPNARREFTPVSDVHIAVVSSSLGDHGYGTVCEGKPEVNDRAHLISDENRPDVPDLSGTNNLRFLVWDNRADDDPRRPEPRGERRLDPMIEDFQNHVVAAGEHGCGYEASLESWYRFLIDPAPPLQVTKGADDTVQRQGVDQVILDQRKAFLRSDSLVAIVMLTDENDCSVQDSGYGWLVASDKMQAGTSACARDPNDRCCTYCGYAVAPDGCPALGTDPACQSAPTDNPNLRCWDQKRRFGVDLLYPTSRYSTALDSKELCPDSPFGDADCQCRRAQELGLGDDCLAGVGKRVRNPLYTHLQASQAGVTVPAEREPDIVFLAGIVGVPWQDLATTETVNEPGKLEFKVSSELDWRLILGEPGTAESPYSPPVDTLMRESVEPRLDGVPHPITGVAPAPPESVSPDANPINGHEWSPVKMEDLQYACVFDLAPLLGDEVRDCLAIGESTCDCYDESADLVAVNARKKPLCQGPNGYSTVQSRAKAYPGLRHLDVLKRYGDNSIVASICPKVLDADENDANYGYNPAVNAIVDRLKERIEGRCLPRRLSYDQQTHKLPCQIVEATPPGGYAAAAGCPEGRDAIDPNKDDDQKLADAVRDHLREAGSCGAGTSSCEGFRLCKLQALDGANRDRCQNDPSELEDVVGYCYVADTADQRIGNPKLMEQCRDSEKRLLRFVGRNVPAQGSTVFVACAGDTYLRE